jgi:uncharacterized protein (DUF697 family)
MAERRNLWENEKSNYIFKAIKKAGQLYIHGFSKDNKMSQDSEQSKHADTIIRNHVIWSMGAGLIPVLIADIFAISALQLDMIRQLCKVYQINFAETQGKAIVTSLTSSTVARITAGSVVKMIPGLGSIIGGITVSVFAGASTYALGEVFKKHFSSGGTILDFDPERLRKLYKEQFEKGKKVVEDIKKREDTTSNVKQNTTDNNDVVSRLRELAELKNQGIITEDEFTSMKKKILEE